MDPLNIVHRQQFVPYEIPAMRAMCESHKIVRRVKQTGEFAIYPLSMQPFITTEQQWAHLGQLQVIWQKLLFNASKDA